MEGRVVVVGSGPSGAMAAATLAERGVDVLLLDAGTRVPRGVVVRAAGNTMFRAVSRREMSADRLDPSSAPDVEWYSSLSLGGLSNYWTAAVPRFAPSDFTAADHIDERYRWPVSYEELIPSYERAERALVVTTGDPIPGVPPNVARYAHRLPADWGRLAARANAAGHAVGALPMAKGRPWMIARRGTEFNSYQCLVAPLLGARPLEVRLGAAVIGLRWSSAGGRVDAVEYLDVSSGRRQVEAARAVVLAAGAIDSTLLLLRSTSSDFPAGLGNANGLVGCYLHDHPREWWVGHLAAPMRALAHPVYIARPPGVASVDATSMTLGLTSAKDRLRTYVRGRAATVGVQVFGTMLPRPDTGVALAADHDVDAPRPRPVIDLRYDEATVANVLSARARIVEVFAAGGSGMSVPGPFHDLAPGSSVHLGGSVRMHHSPEFGVLDGWNRIHDVPNVAVVDNSCFTTGPEKNPTLTAMALAVRASARLADDLAAGAV